MKRLFNLILAAVLLAVPAWAQAQKHTVSGVVTEKLGDDIQPVPGVVVLVKGATAGGAVTDELGQYSIAVGRNAVLVFTCLGYSDQEIPVNGRETVDVLLTVDTEMLDDVVVVGYGVQRRSDVSGSVTSVTAEELAATPATNVSEMLRGRASGVQVTVGSGRPGDESSIQIRGVRSVNDGSNTPMYVIDGVVASATEFNAIAPDDVENLEILKDAASQAIYGARAANGVIIVTTKRGKKGEDREKAQITFTSSISSQHLWKNFSFYDGDEFVELKRQAKANDMGIDDPQAIAALPLSEIIDDNISQEVYASKDFTDWEKVMFSPAIIQKYDLSVRGGTKALAVAASAGWMDHNGMVNIESRLQRANFRLNVDYEARKWLTIGVSSSYIKSKNLGGRTSFNSYITSDPLGRVYDEDGNYTQYINSSGVQNPFWNATYSKNRTDTNITRLNGYIDLHPVKGLSYRLNLGYMNQTGETSAYRKKEYSGGGAAGSISDTGRLQYTVENIVNYTVPFTNRDLSLVLTGVQGYEHSESSGINIAADTVPIDEYWWHMIGAGVNTDFGHTFTEYNLLSWLGRAQFSYKDRYLANIALRADGSSRFGSGNKWGYFPSISAAWRVSQEPFMRDVRWVSNLKLRASYGLVGNMNGIGNYETLGAARDYEYEFGSTYYHGYLPSSALPNVNLKWESTASANFAVDFGLFKNRLNGTVEYYRTTTSNLLFPRQINSALGYSSMTDNVAQTKTNGWDINLDGAIVRNRDFEWTAGLVFSAFNNKITKLSGEVDEDGNPVNDAANGWFIGEPINVYYTYKTDGIYQYEDFNGQDADGNWIQKNPIQRDDKVAPGMIKVVDKDGNGIINADDRFVIPRDPKWVGSFNTALKFRGFELYMDWYAVYGRMQRNSYLHEFNSGGSLQGKYNGIKVNYWTPSNPSNEFPRPNYNSVASHLGDLAICDASYLRLRTLSLGYNVNPTFLKKINVRSSKISLTATNLLTFTKYLSYSPETSAGDYPEPRQYNVTFTFTF